MLKKITLTVFYCFTISLLTFAQSKSKYNLRGLQYAFDRAAAAAAPTDYNTIYIVFYGGTKSGWNAKANKSYPVQEKLIWSKMIKLTGLPPARDYRPENADQLYPGLRKYYLDHLIKQYGFDEENNYVTFIGDYDFNFVEKKVEETMKQQEDFYPKSKFVYDSKFSFSYADPKYKVSYKGESK